MSNKRKPESTVMVHCPKCHTNVPTVASRVPPDGICWWCTQGITLSSVYDGQKRAES